MEDKIKINVENKEEIESVLIEIVYYLLYAKSIGMKVECELNGHVLNSTTITMKDAYQKVLGITSEEFDKIDQEWQERALEEEKELEEARKNIPYWIQEGKKYIYEERYFEWENTVKARVEDLYHGLELDAFLDLVSMQAKGASQKEVVKRFLKQGHSDLSSGLMVGLMLKFSKQGPDFIDELYKEEMLDPEDRVLIESKRRENQEFEKKLTLKTRYN